MHNRRYFLEKMGIGFLAAPIIRKGLLSKKQSGPIVISTWDNRKANNIAFDAYQKKKNILDAVELGVNYVESNEEDQSVGKGGRPDRTGKPSLDACIMNSKGDAGSVAFVRNIEHPISLARKVMESTPHVMLAGKGAEKFAKTCGFPKSRLLTKKSKKAWKEWKKKAVYKPTVNIEMHDTIGMLGLDENRNLVGACSTSGLAYKMEGRVGDSPIIGAGLFLDNEIGGAVATGMGEEVMKTCGTFLVVELMRQGKSPQKACQIAVERLTKSKMSKEIQVGYIAINKSGEIGGYSLQKGFIYAVKSSTQDLVLEAVSHYE